MTFPLSLVYALLALEQRGRVHRDLQGSKETFKLIRAWAVKGFRQEMQDVYGVGKNASLRVQEVGVCRPGQLSLLSPHAHYK